MAFHPLRTKIDTSFMARFQGFKIPGFLRQEPLINRAFINIPLNNGVIDEFDTANNGTQTGQTFVASDIGPYATVAQGNGTGEISIITATTRLGAIGTGQFFISYWTYAKAVPGAIALQFGSFDGAGIGPTIFIAEGTALGFTDKLVMSLTPGSRFGSTVSAISLRDKWTHIVFQRLAGNTCEMYVNGALDTTFSDATNVPAPTLAYMVGNGQLENSGARRALLRMDRRSLTQSEIRTLYMEGLNMLT